MFFSGTSQSSIAKLREYGDVLIFSAIFPFRRVWAKSKPPIDLKQKPAEFTWVPDYSALIQQANFYSFLRNTMTVDFVSRAADLKGEIPKFLISVEGADTIADPTDIYSLYDLGILAYVKSCLPAGMSCVYYYAQFITQIDKFLASPGQAIVFF